MAGAWLYSSFFFRPTKITSFGIRFLKPLTQVPPSLNKAEAARGLGVEENVVSWYNYTGGNNRLPTINPTWCQLF